MEIQGIVGLRGYRYIPGLVRGNRHLHLQVCRNDQGLQIRFVFLAGKQPCQHKNQKISKSQHR